VVKRLYRDLDQVSDVSLVSGRIVGRRTDVVRRVVGVDVPKTVDVPETVDVLPKTFDVPKTCDDLPKRCSVRVSRNIEFRSILHGTGVRRFGVAIRR
jgi:hypothetical protein